MPKITNTRAEVASNPFIGLAVAMGGIEAEEARGQSEFVHSDQIPANMRGGLTEAMLIEMGFQLGEPTPDDPLFRAATLPPGWSKVKTDHSMWSSIVDEKGRKRISVFYKAAFYDRSAHISAVERYGLATEYGDQAAGEKVERIYMTDCGEKVGNPLAEYDDSIRGAYDKAWKTARAALADREAAKQRPRSPTPDTSYPKCTP